MLNKLKSVWIPQISFAHIKKITPVQARHGSILLHINLNIFLHVKILCTVVGTEGEGRRCVCVGGGDITAHTHHL